MEEDAIRKASAVVFVTDETADLVMTKYPAAWRRKAFVVPHGFDARLGGATSRPADRRLPMRIVYTGRFYAGVRTPLPLLRALADLNRREALAGTLEVLFLGPRVDEFEREAEALGLASFVRFRGRVPPVEAASAAAESAKEGKERIERPPEPNERHVERQVSLIERPESLDLRSFLAVSADDARSGQILLCVSC